MSGSFTYNYFVISAECPTHYTEGWSGSLLISRHFEWCLEKKHALFFESRDHGGRVVREDSVSDQRKSMCTFTLYSRQAHIFARVFEMQRWSSVAMFAFRNFDTQTSRAGGMLWVSDVQECPRIQGNFKVGSGSVKLAVLLRWVHCIDFWAIVSRQVQ